MVVFIKYHNDGRGGALLPCVELPIFVYIFAIRRKQISLVIVKEEA